MGINKSVFVKVPHLAILLLLPLVSWAEERTGLIYSLGKVGAAKVGDSPLFFQKTKWSNESDGIRRVSTQIRDRTGVLALEEEARFRGNRLISQHVRQFQTGEAYRVRVEEKKVIYEISEIQAGKEVLRKTEKEDRSEDFISGPVAEPYLVSQFDALSAGKRINARFGILELGESVGFDFQSNGPALVEGKNVLVVTMKPSSFFISILVNAIELHFDLDTKKMIRYRGRTPLKISDHGRMKPLDAEILYTQNQDASHELGH